MCVGRHMKRNEQNADNREAERRVQEGWWYISLYFGVCLKIAIMKTLKPYEGYRHYLLTDVCLEMSGWGDLASVITLVATQR